MKQKSILTILKVLVMIALWPFTVVWLIWKKLNWSKKGKWIATAVWAVFLIIIIPGSPSEPQNPSQTAEKATSKPKPSIEENTLSEAQNNVQADNNDQQIQNAQQTDIAVVEPTQDQSAEQDNSQPETFKVVNVVDGDTIKLDNGKVVRYIGIDTPETVHPSQSVECFGKEASNKNTELVEGKEVRLEKDVSETDKYGRLLRYVYVGDTMVNDYLVRNGFANASSYPPDVKYQDQFRQSEEEAKNNKRGLWADNACKTEQAPVPTPTPKPASTPTTGTTSGGFTCNCKKTCAQMGCAEAQYQLNTCGCAARDADKDGVACDADCQ